MALTRQEMLLTLLSNIPDEFDKSVGSFFYDALMPVAIELEGIYGEIEDILPNAFAMTGSGTYLEYKVAEQGLFRKSATKAIGYVTVTGDVGAFIKIGGKVAADTLTFSVLENATLTNGTATVKIECDTAGSIGNVPVGAINRFPVTLSGLISVINNTAIGSGFDAETDDELRERYFLKVSRPSTSGNIYDYMDWANEISGVGGVKVIPLWNGAGTVKVMIINSNGLSADNVLIDKVSDNIEAKRPIGADVTVVSAEPLQLNISLKVTLRTGSILDDVVPQIQAVLSKYLKEIAFKQNYVSFAYVGSKILSIDEILDYEDLTVNNAVDNVDIAENEVPVLGELEVRS